MSRSFENDERVVDSELPLRPTPVWQVFLLALLLLAAAVAAYQPVWHAGFIWDDDIYVTTNKLLSAPDGLWRIWFSFDSPSQYFPLTYTTLWVEHALWGLNPVGYHWVNLALHAANALLLWRLLSRLRIPGAWLGAALFALHPVQVESVAWISERKNVLMGFFFLLTLLVWQKFVAGKRRGEFKLYLLALICYVLALAAKTTACTLPAALLLMLWLKRGSIRAVRIVHVMPFVVLGVGAGLLTIWWEKYHQGTEGQLFALGIPERLLVAARAFWFYLGETGLAGRSRFQLSALDTRDRAIDRLRLGGRFSPARAVDFDFAALGGAGPGGGAAVFRGHAFARAGVHHALHVSLQLRGGSLSIPGRDRPAHAGGGWR